MLISFSFLSLQKTMGIVLVRKTRHCIVTSIRMLPMILTTDQMLLYPPSLDSSFAS